MNERGDFGTQLQVMANIDEPALGRVERRLVTDAMAKANGISYRHAAERAMRVLSGDWVIAVLTALGGGPLRSNDLLAAINDVEDQVGRDMHKVPLTRGVLSPTLTRMSAAGLVTRAVEPGPPRKVWYGLTPSGRRLLTAVGSLADWALRHQAETSAGPDVEDGRTSFDQA